MTSMAVAQTPTDRTDEYLAEAARAGDTAAFTQLVERYRAVACAYAYACLRQREEAEDVAQEAFVRAFQALPRFRRNACWSAWMMRILRNLCTDALRRRRGRATQSLQEAWSDDTASPELLALAREYRRELNEAVASLPEKYRIPLLMHYACGRTYREIAVALDLPESTVVGRMAGALSLLRRRLHREEAV
jgi:RNA polymerase sigma-70 factor (ECF subfamily)